MREDAQLYPASLIDLFPEKKVRAWMEQQEVVFKKNEMLAAPDVNSEAVYLIQEGNVRIFNLHLDGKECILGLLSKGEFVGLFDAFSTKEPNTFAVALTEVKAVKVLKSEMMEIVGNTPELATALLFHLADRLQETIEVLGQVAYGKVEERLLFLLQKVADESKSEDEWSPLPEYLTHKDLAGMIGSTRETVTFVLNKLIQEKRIRQKKEKLWIKSAEK